MKTMTSLIDWSRSILLATISAALVAGALATEADANHRFRHRQWRGFDQYDVGPVYVPVPRFYRYFVDPDEAFFDEPDAEYGDYFDKAYYEPSVEYPPDRPAKIKNKKKLAASPAASNKSTAKQTASIAPKPQAAAALSCDKATGIVSGFGFASVKANDCEGQVYAFSATRDGKPYAIKLNATNGELTEVRKLQ